MAQEPINANEENRQALIAWLVNNDPNGCYTDEDCDNEDQPRLTLQEAVDLYMEQNPDNQGWTFTSRGAILLRQITARCR